MKLEIGIAVSLTLCVAGVVRADTFDQRQAAVRDCMTALSSPETSVRSRAAERLTELSLLGAKAIALHGQGLDDQAWAAVSAAFVHKKDTLAAGWFVAGAATAPPAHAKRLLALARALVPDAGTALPPDEVEKRIRSICDEEAGTDCRSGFDLRIAVMGHQAVPPLLRIIESDKTGGMPGGAVCGALSLLAGEKDVPRLESLLLRGQGGLPEILDALQRRGISKATDALLGAVAAGRMDSHLASALRGVPDRSRATAAVTRWIADRSRVGEDARRYIADLLEDLEVSDSLTTLRGWAATSKKPRTLAALAHALVHFGDPKGVEMYVHVLGEKKTRFPCRPSTPAERAAAASPGRLCPDGFETMDRARAANILARIAGPSVFEVHPDPSDWSVKVPAGETETSFLDRAATAFRAWWDTARGKLRFDPGTGRWTVGG